MALIEPYRQKHIISLLNKLFWVIAPETVMIQHDLEKLENITLITLDDNIKQGYGVNHNFDHIYD